MESEKDREVKGADAEQDRDETILHDDARVSQGEDRGIEGEE